MRSPFVASSASTMAPGSTRYITPLCTIGMVSLVPGPRPRVQAMRSWLTLRAINLLERAEALRVVGAAVHQPVVRAGMQEHVLGDRNEVLHYLRVRACRASARITEHESCWPSFYSIRNDRITSIGRSLCEVLVVFLIGWQQLLWRRRRTTLSARGHHAPVDDRHHLSDIRRDLLRGPRAAQDCARLGRCCGRRR